MSNGESFPSDHKISSNEDVFDKANPFTYQHLDPEDLQSAGRVSEKGRESDTFVADGYTFHKIKEHQMPERQYLTSLVLKGISNVSDIVRGPDGALYSKDMHSGSENTVATAPSEQYADMLVLSTIFNDMDHSVGKFPNNISFKDGSHALFDFDGRHRGRNPRPEDYVGTYDFNSRPLEGFTQIPEDQIAESVLAYKGKIKSLQALYDSADGKAAFIAMAIKSNVADFAMFDTLYEQFIGQLHRASEISDEEIIGLIRGSNSVH